MAHISYTAGTTGGQGAPGPAGNDGAQGATGTQGAQGTQGTQGLQGIVGSQGSNGTQGAQGYNGPQGLQGTTGTTGTPGSQGSTGTQGAQGYTGAQGTTGAQGVQGSTGTQGSVGTQGAQGAQGANGTSGSNGAQGVQGIQGLQGNIGSQGLQGVQGYTGTTGAQGAVGTKGDNGYTGAQGTQGPQGIQGGTGATGAGGTVGYYGSWQSNVSQSAATTGTAYSITYDTLDEAFGWNLSNGSRLNCPATGVYNIQYSVQLHNNSGGGSGTDVNIWLAKNGVTVADTDSVISVNTNSPYIITAVNYVLTINAGEYVELKWSTNNTSIVLAAIPTAAPAPLSPAIITTITPVVHSIQGTQGLQGTTGSQGANGSNGSAGSQGAQGAQGATGTGAQGAQGIQGTTGAQGAQGLQGPLPTSPLTLAYSATTTDPLTITSGNQHGGSTFAGLMTLQSTISGATNPKKYIRMNNTGGLEIIDDGYATTIMSLSNGGALATSNTITPGAYTAGQHIKTTIWSASDMSFNSTYTNASTTYTTIASKTYTPASASSYIFFEVYARYYVNGASEDSFFSQLTWNGAEFAAQRQYWANASGGGTRSSTLFPLAGRVTNGSLTGYTFAVNARRDSSDDTLSVYADSAFYVKITEIAR